MQLADGDLDTCELLHDVLDFLVLLRDQCVLKRLLGWRTRRALGSLLGLLDRTGGEKSREHRGQRRDAGIAERPNSSRLAPIGRVIAATVLLAGT